MQKLTLNENQYIAELNQRLLKHELYQVGMAFIPYPEGTEGDNMSGYSVTGPFELMSVYAQVASQVMQQFVLHI